MQLQPNERDKIAILKTKGLPIRQITKQLSRHHSVVSRKLKRNKFKDDYVSIHTQRLGNQRKIKFRHRHSLKNKKIYSYVLKN